MDYKPRVNALTGRSGARVFFENSTACSKVSAMFVMPRGPRLFGCGFGVPLVMQPRCGVVLPGLFSLVDCPRFCAVVVCIDGEFDPGSGRTLAACLTHASRTVNLLRWGISGERVSNTWATCPQLWDNSKKLGLILDMTADRMVWWWKDLSAGDGPAAYQLVGGVVAYQGDDG